MTTPPHHLLSVDDQSDLLKILEQRFAKHPNRHPNQSWVTVQNRLLAQPAKLWSLYQMEETGGQPDVVGQDAGSGELVFMDCAPESPVGRRNTCYDNEALEARKTFKPKTSAQQQATKMGVVLLTEAKYRHLQSVGSFDCKTSSWLNTPAAIRTLGGAIFGDRRFNTVFIYHNGAESYYGARGWRGCLTI